MSLAAALGTMGLAIRDVNREQRRIEIENEQIANMREDRAYQSKMREFSLADVERRANDDKIARQRIAAYGEIAKSAINDDDLMQKTIAKARELGDFEKLNTERTRYAELKSAQLKTAVDGGLRQLMGTGDPTGLQNAYNKLFPDGNQVSVARREDGKYDLSFVGADGRPVAQQAGMTTDQIGMMAMKLLDPKFAKDTWIQSMKDESELKKEEAKGRAALERDKAKAEFTSKLEDQRDANRSSREESITRLRAKLDRENSMATIGAQSTAAKGLASHKAQLEGSVDPNATPETKDIDRRVKQGRAALDKYFGISSMVGLDPKQQGKYLDALELMNKDIRSGVDPEEAAVRAARSADAKMRADKIAPKDASRGFAGLPAYK